MSVESISTYHTLQLFLAIRHVSLTFPRHPAAKLAVETKQN